MESIHVISFGRPDPRDENPQSAHSEGRSEGRLLATAIGPQREMVGVRDVDGEVKVATVERVAELSSRGVRDPPVAVLKGVQDAVLKGFQCAAASITECSEDFTSS